MRTAVVRSTSGKLWFAAGVVAATLTLPYLFPVAPAVGLSYITQFSNRAAVAMFVLGSLLFAWFTRGQFPRDNAAREGGGPSTVSLMVAVCLILLLLWADLFDAVQHKPGSELFYNANRLYMLMSGARPYRDFEYAYGPLHLYVPWIFARLTHRPAIYGYYLWWALQWLTGVALWWALARWLPFQQRWRERIFWSLVILQSMSLWSEGAAYTPWRLVGAAFLILGVQRVLQRRRPWLVVCASLGAVVVALGVSPEQGIGVAAGLLTWLGLLAWTSRFARLPALAVLLGTTMVLLLAAHLCMFATAAAFSRGAYSFPLLLSGFGLLVMLTYLFAPVAALQQIASGQWESSAIPLAVGGLVMLPSAFGRCDYGHLQMASPALLCGAAFLQTQPTLRQVWTTAFACFAVLPTLAGEVQDVSARIHQAATAHAMAGRHVDRTPSSPGTNAAVQPQQPGRSAATPQAALPHRPCPQIYRAPMINVPTANLPDDVCIEPGYYMGLVNVFEAAAVRRKIAEMEQHPRKPLLIQDGSLQGVVYEDDRHPEDLRGSQGAFFVPPARRDPFSYAELFDYVRQNYKPEPNAVGGVRVWRPIVP